MNVTGPPEQGQMAIAVATLEYLQLLTLDLLWSQMVVLMDPMEDPDDILRANRSREKTYMFDVTFDYLANQVSPREAHCKHPDNVHTCSSVARLVLKATYQLYYYIIYW